MAALFAGLPEALAVTQTIAERCQVSLDFSRRRLPVFPARTDDFPQGIPPGETAFGLLRTLCQAGLQVRYGLVTPRATQPAGA